MSLQPSVRHGGGSVLVSAACQPALESFDQTDQV